MHSAFRSTVVRRGMAFLLAVAVCGAGGAAPARASAPASHPPDGRGAGPLALRGAHLAQRGPELVLRVRTRGTWSAGALPADGLCLVTVAAGARARACVNGDGRGAAIVRVQPAAAGGGWDAAGHVVRARVARPDRRSVVVRVDPAAVPLPFGRVRWAVETRWHDGGRCAGGCGDRLPRHGWHALRVSAFGAPRCFGAAARARRRPCVNPALARSAVPSPDDALLLPDATCLPRVDTRAYDVAEPCDIGLRDRRVAPQLALIGDSHSAHLRAAVDVLARARGWRAVSVTHPGCAFSTEAYPAPPPIPARCRQHTEEALQWLARHPSVDTVITSASAGRGLGAAGFLAAWGRMPATVRRLFVVRDVPRMRYSTGACVTAAVRAGRRPGAACAVPRASAFPSDPAMQAAAGGGDRFRLLDLTRVFCDAARCYPVIGGVYAYKDDNHLNRVFSATLGPVLLGMIGAG